MATQSLKFIFSIFILFYFPSSIFSSEFIIPSYEDFKKKFPPSDAILLAKDGTQLQILRTDFNNRRMVWMEIDSFPPHLIQAILKTEDQSFWEHSGVDTLALLSSLYSGISRKGIRGGSTISMQIASFLDPSLGGMGKRRSLFQKIRQIQRANQLEDKWSKQEILAAYLNLIYLKGELQGIPVAGLEIWGVVPKSLDKKMSLVLAVMIRSPNAKNSLLAKRSYLLGKSLKWNYSEQEMIDFIETSFSNPKYLSKSFSQLAFHYAMRFSNSQNGIIPSTIDRNLQILAINSLKNNLLSVKEKNVRDGGILVLENSTGNVLAYVGGIEGLSSAEYVDSVQSYRQAGSTLKPFLYALAIEKKWITPTSILKDSPLDIDVTRGMYRPSNYDKDFKGNIFVKQALASSLNIPAVRIIQLTSVDLFYDRIQSLGFTNLKSSDYYGYSLALGTLDVRLWDLTHAYRILASGGNSISGDQITSHESSYIVSYLLSDRENRSMTFGLENPLATRFWTAVKTGTSQDMRDNWCVGYSDTYTVGVWIGNFSGEPMHDITGISGAGPIWREIMEYLHKDKSSYLPKPPPNLVYKFGDYYIKGTEPNLDPILSIVDSQDSSQQQQPPRIDYPKDGLIVAMDPDIPTSLQRILFRSQGDTRNLFWMLNHKILGSAKFSFPWIVRKGKYQLSLISQSDEIIETVHFEVR
jgi:penicillin-binding protein 1C